MFCCYILKSFGPKLEPKWPPNLFKTFQKCVSLPPGRHFGGSWDVFVWQTLDTNFLEFFVKASGYSEDLIGISGLLLGIHGASSSYSLELHAVR